MGLRASQREWWEAGRKENTGGEIDGGKQGTEERRHWEKERRETEQKGGMKGEREEEKGRGKEEQERRGGGEGEEKDGASDKRR